MLSRRVPALLAVCLFLAPVLGAILGYSPTAIAQSNSPITLGGILSELDRHAPSFHGLSADVERTKVTVVVNDRSSNSGTVLVQGEKMLLQMNPPDARTVLKSGDTLDVYTPGLKRVEEYDLGKNRALVDEFMLLGFGTRGTQLEGSYEVSLAGEPALDGKKTVELELIPKSQGVKNQFSKIQIWYDPTNWLPVRQEFYETGSGDYSIVQYSNVVENPRVNDSQFKPHWPKGTEKVKPQG